MEILPTLLGALPDLGVAGVVLVVMIVGQRILTGERAYFTEERKLYRAEAREDRAELKQEIRDLKTENAALEDLVDVERGKRRRGDDTAQLPTIPPAARHGLADSA